MKTAESILLEKNKPMLTVASSSTLYEAICQMEENNTGSVVVKDNDEIVGIWTEKHLLHQIAQKDIDIKKEKIKNYMSESLVKVRHDDPVYILQDKMLGVYTRYLFVVKEEKIIGLLSIGDVLRAILNERTEQLKSVAWEYYDNWNWKKK